MRDARNFASKVEQKKEGLRSHFERLFQLASNEVESWSKDVENPTIGTNIALLKYADKESYLPDFLRKNVNFNIDKYSKIL